MVKYTELKKTEIVNGNKYCYAIIRKGEYDEYFHFFREGDKTFNITYDIVSRWFNGKREQNSIKQFVSLEKAEKFYQKKIKDIKKKIA